MLHTARRRLITGFLAVLPAIFTVWALLLLVTLADGMLQPVIRWTTGENIPGAGLILSLLLLYIVGGLVPNDLVGRLIIFFESIFGRIPLAGAIYSASKQTIEALQTSLSDQRFDRVVFVEYPRKGTFALGFVTKEIDLNGTDSLCVFIPTTPNPTSGMLIIVSREDALPSQLSIEQAVKFVISGGVVSR